MEPKRLEMPQTLDNRNEDRRGETEMTVKREVPSHRQIVDEEGFLLQPDVWDKKVARTLSRREVSGNLTPDHWKLIDCVRQYYLDFKTVPPVRMLVRRTGLPIRRIHELFPNGFSNGACKATGLPRQVLKATRILNVAGK